MSEYVIANDDYLAHHGVLGQKWGVRRYQNADGTRTAKGKAHEEALNAKAEKKANIASAKAAYKQSKKDLKESYKAYKKESRKQGLIASYDKKQQLDKAEKKNQEAYINSVKAKADLAKAKGGEKAELNSYAKSLRKTGLSGSIKDYQYNNISTKLCKNLETTKGKEYMQKVENKAKTQLVTQVAVGTTIAVGALAVSMMLDK